MAINSQATRGLSRPLMQPLVDGRHNLATLCFMHNTTGTSLDVNCIDRSVPFALLKQSYAMPSMTWSASFKLLLLEHKYLQATSYPCHRDGSLIRLRRIAFGLQSMPLE